MRAPLTILCYHRVLPDEARRGAERAYFARGTAVSERNFAVQVRAIQERFEVLGEEAVLAWLAGERKPARPACWLTFDDGYREVVDHVAPLLAAQRLPATVFVTTGVLDSSDMLLPADRWYAVLGAATRPSGTLDLDSAEAPWNFELPRDYTRFIDGPERRRYLRAGPIEQEALLDRLAEALGAGTPPCGSLYLDGDDLRHLRAGGWSVGGHGHSHALLTQVDDAHLEVELAGPARSLRAIGLEPRTFAYPDGAHDARVTAAIRISGWAAAVTLGQRAVQPEDEPFLLPRFIPADRPRWVEEALESAVRGQYDRTRNTSPK